MKCNLLSLYYHLQSSPFAEPLNSSLYVAEYFKAETVSVCLIEKSSPELFILAIIILPPHNPPNAMLFYYMFYNGKLNDLVLSIIFTPSTF